MYERILVPTDGSTGVDRAVEHAVDLARTYGAQLHVLNVVNVASLSVEANSQAVIDQLEEQGEELTYQVAEQATDAGVEDVVTEVTHGIPHQTILEYADERGMDLVVMGTHGRTGLEHYLLGSVTEKVVRSSDVPVLTVRAPEESE
jgi:nucleotide-binding universal stress UspA family protein